MMLPVICHPLRDRALGRHRTENRQRAAEPRRRLEALVTEEPVIADSDAETAEDVEHHEQHDVEPGQGHPPEQPGRREQAERRHDHRDKGDGPARAARTSAHRSDCDVGHAVTASSIGDGEGTSR